MNDRGATPPLVVRTRASGRVNLIGDHVDYMGGPVLPMTIELATTVEVTPGGIEVNLRSEAEPSEALLTLPVLTIDGVSPPWARFVAAVAHTLRSTVGVKGTVRSTLPAGAGLSSSAALEIAVALALITAGAPHTDPQLPRGEAAMELARRCQRAEHLATGVPTGLMDQMSILLGRAGHASLIDCTTLAVEMVELPPQMAIWVLHSGQHRELAGSEYTERRAAAEAAARLLGPLPGADPAQIDSITDLVLRRRARHVNSESRRVREFATALRGGDLVAAGELMSQSHRSLRDDYEVSTPVLDRLVEALEEVPGVFGARLTGAGFGGCVVALADPAVDLTDRWGELPMRRRVTASDGISVEAQGLR